MRGCFHRSYSVRDVGCEGQEKIWMKVWCFPPQEERRGIGNSYILSRQEWRNWEMETGTELGDGNHIWAMELYFVC